MAWDIIFRERKEVNEPENFVIDFYKKYKTGLKNSKILDLGCGTGRHTIFFADKGFKVYALDKSKMALNLLEEKIKKGYKIKLVNTEMAEIPFPNRFFNVVIVIWVLHHSKIKQIKNYLREIRRVLKSNGFLVLSVLSKNDWRYDAGKEIEPNTRINISDTFDPEIPHHFFSKEEIVQFLNDFSILEMKETEKLSAKSYGKFRHWNIIARFK